MAVIWGEKLTVMNKSALRKKTTSPPKKTFHDDASRTKKIKSRHRCYGVELRAGKKPALLFARRVIQDSEGMMRVEALSSKRDAEAAPKCL